MREVMVRLALAVTFGIAVAGSVRADGAPATPRTAAAQLAAVDRVFVASYGRAVADVIAGGPPAFLVLPDKMVLYRRGARQEWPLIPPLFNELKTVAHVTLGLFAVLSPTDGRPLAADDATALRRYQELIATARGAIQEVGLSEAQLERQLQILAASQQLAERALADG